MNLLKEFFEQKQRLQAEQEKLREIEEKIYLSIPQNEIPDEGTFKLEQGDYKLVLTTKYSVKVDESIAKMYPQFFKQSFDFSKTIYKSLSDIEKNLVDKGITKTPAKPNFKVELV